VIKSKHNKTRAGNRLG